MSRKKITKPLEEIEKRVQEEKKKSQATTKRQGQGARARRFETDPEVLERLEEAVKLGLSVDDACVYAGLHRSSYYEWVKKYPEVTDLLKKAEMTGKVHHLKRIYGGDKQWQSSAWFLERKFKEEWSLRSEQDPPKKEFKVVFESKEILGDGE